MASNSYNWLGIHEALFLQFKQAFTPFSKQFKAVAFHD
jgi:hypothetical protein